MIILFKCNNSECTGSTKKFFRNSKDIPSELDCDKCKGKLERQLSSPSTKSTIIIDTGAQQRQVEVTTAVIEKETDRINSKE